MSRIRGVWSTTHDDTRHGVFSTHKTGRLELALANEQIGKATREDRYVVQLAAEAWLYHISGAAVSTEEK